jgi:hypothetical protein
METMERVKPVKDAAYWRDEARRARQREEESFQRSDTDGCVSQWCLGFTAREADARAEILENHGTSLFCGLYEGFRRVKAKQIETEFGWCWLLDQSETALIAKRGKRFVPCEGYRRKSRVLSKLGLSERYERAPAWAKVDAPAGAKGFSGLTSLYINVYRTGDEWGSDALLEEHLCIQEHR